MEIYELNNDINLNNISLDNPHSVQGGSFFTKILLDNKPLYFQLPKCSTKQGLVETKKNKYFDLLYDKNSEDLLIEWIEKFENQCLDCINKKKNLWFSNDIDKDDIQNLMTPLVRMYSSGKKLLFRTYIDTNKTTGISKCKVYNENEESIDLRSVDNNSTLIPLILIEGIKFSSKSFEIIVKLNQIMILKTEPEISDVCLIKKKPALRIANTLEKKVIKTKEEEPIKEEVHVKEEVEVKQDEPIKDDDDVKINVNDDESVNDDKVEAVNDVEDVNDDESVNDDKPVNDDKIEKHVGEVKNDVLNIDLNEINIDTLEKINDIEEINIEIPQGDPLKLVKPQEVYYNMYKEMMTRAKQSRKEALNTFLEAKNIKTKYMLDDIDDSEEEEEEFYNIEN